MKKKRTYTVCMVCFHARNRFKSFVLSIKNKCDHIIYFSICRHEANLEFFFIAKQKTKTKKKIPRPTLYTCFNFRHEAITEVFCLITKEKLVRPTFYRGPIAENFSFVFFTKRRKEPKHCRRVSLHT